MVALRAELTRLDPSEYHEVVCEWRVSQLLIYLEESRVRSEFDDMEDDV